MVISASANGKPGDSAVGSLYSSFSETKNSSKEAACPLANEIANCRPAARHVRKVTAKSSTASHKRCGLGLGGCQTGSARGISPLPGVTSATSTSRGNCFSLCTTLGCQNCGESERRALSQRDGLPSLAAKRARPVGGPPRQISRKLSLCLLQRVCAAISLLAPAALSRA